MDAQPAAVDFLDRLLDVINDGMSRMSRHDRGPNLACVLLMSRGWNSLYRGREDAPSGFYTQALTMRRAAFEDWVVIRYLQRNPAHAAIWLKDVIFEHAEEQRRPPQFRALWNELDAEQSKLAADLYGELSELGAHPRAAGMALQFDHASETVSPRVGGTFNEADLKKTLHYLLTVAMLLLGHVPTLQTAMLGAVVDDWETSFRSAISDSAAILSSLESGLR